MPDSPWRACYSAPGSVERGSGEFFSIYCTRMPYRVCRTYAVYNMYIIIYIYIYVIAPAACVCVHVTRRILGCVERIAASHNNTHARREASTTPPRRTLMLHLYSDIAYKTGAAARALALALAATRWRRPVVSNPRPRPLRGAGERASTLPWR